LAPILAYLQDSGSVFTQDSALRHQVIQLLQAAVISASGAVPQQAEALLALLMQLRANVLLVTDLPVQQLQMVCEAVLRA